MSHLIPFLSKSLPSPAQQGSIWYIIFVINVKGKSAYVFLILEMGQFFSIVLQSTYCSCFWHKLIPEKPSSLKTNLNF